MFARIVYGAVELKEESIPRVLGDHGAPSARVVIESAIVGAR